MSRTASYSVSVGAPVKVYITVVDTTRKYVYIASDIYVDDNYIGRSGPEPYEVEVQAGTHTFCADATWQGFGRGCVVKTITEPTELEIVIPTKS